MFLIQVLTVYCRRCSLQLYQDVVEECMKEYFEVTRDCARPPILFTTANSKTCAGEVRGNFGMY